MGPMGGHSFPIPTASHNVIAPLLVVGAFSKLIFFSEAPAKAHDRKGIPALLSLLQLVFDSFCMFSWSGVCMLDSLECAK